MISRFLGPPQGGPLKVSSTPSNLEVVVLPLVTDGTHEEIFHSLGFELGLIAILKPEVQAFRREHEDVLLEEDHATLILQGAGGHYVVAEMERDGCETIELPLHHEWVWKAADNHQVVVPAWILEPGAGDLG